MAGLSNGHTMVYITPNTAPMHGELDGYGGGGRESRKSSDGSSMHSLASTVFLAEHSDRSMAHNGTAVANKRNDNTHVVTIKINHEANKLPPTITSVQLKSPQSSGNFHNKSHNSSVRLNVDTEYCNKENLDKNEPFINYNTYPLNVNMVMSSGQCSPSDTLDSGTCSDLDGTPPPLPKKKTSRQNSQKKISVTHIKNNDDVDYEDNDSSVSYDSLNSSELSGSVHLDESIVLCDKVKNNESHTRLTPKAQNGIGEINNFLQRCLLQDIRERSSKLDANPYHEIDVIDEESVVVETLKNASMRQTDKSPVISESTYEERRNSRKEHHETQSIKYEADRFYDFHLNEKVFGDNSSEKLCEVNDDKSISEDLVECFAGVKDLKSEEKPATIKSSKGTIRGVKNRVRAGIATFLQIQNTPKNFKDKDSNKVVLYSTTMGIVRSTYQRCTLVKKILRNLLIKFEERDVFMSREYQDEIKERMKSTQILVPQLFVDGQYIGDADAVEKLNESGELRKMLKPYKSPDACSTCKVCGGFRLLPCQVCNGSKKSLHRNSFTAEFVALKCMNCDEVGLVRCEACA